MMLAAAACQAPFAQIHLAQDDRHASPWGLASGSRFAPDALSKHVMADGGLLVPDASIDPRFCADPVVLGQPGIRGFLCVALLGEGGHTMGTFCVMDTRVRLFSQRETELVQAAARALCGHVQIYRASAAQVRDPAHRHIQPAPGVESVGLVDSERSWRALVEQSPVAVAVIGLDGRFRYGNPQAADIYGVGHPAELVGRRAADFVPAGSRADTRALFAAAAAGQLIRGRRWTLRRADGADQPVEINAVLGHYNTGPAIQVELRDMTAQAAAESALKASESRWRSLFEASPVAIGLADDNGLFAAVNPALCQLLGRTDDEIIGHSAADFTHPDDLDTHRRSGQLISAAPGGIVRIHKRFLRSDGEVRWGWLTLTHLPGPSGAPWTLAHMLDVTDRKAEEQALTDSEANLRAVSTVVKKIQSGADARQTVVEECQHLARAAHVTLLEPAPGGDALQVTASTDPTFLGTVVALTATSATVAAYLDGAPHFLADAHHDPQVSPALRAMSQAASLYIVPVTSGPDTVGVLTVDWTDHVPNLDDRRAAVVTLLADHTGVALRQAALIAELENLAHTDALTELPNRRGWQQLFELHLSLCRRADQPLTVAIVDIDHFKQYNDRHGHPAGDDLLHRFAAAVAGLVRDSDTFARWGGEEFTIALPNCQAANARDVLERIQQAMPDGQTCSIGHATLQPDETAEHLLARADAALYHAKTNGRNRIIAAACDT